MITLSNLIRTVDLITFALIQTDQLSDISWEIRRELVDLSFLYFFFNNDNYSDFNEWFRFFVLFFFVSNEKKIKRIILYSRSAGIKVLVGPKHFFKALFCVS